MGGSGLTQHCKVSVDGREDALPTCSLPCCCPGHLLPLTIPVRLADPDGRMGDYAIQAAEATYRQALSVGLNTTKVSGLWKPACSAVDADADGCLCVWRSCLN